MSCLLISLPRAAAARQSDGTEAETEVALAEQKAAQAFDAYQAKRFAEAVALYVEAYDAAPNADILYNVARIYDTKLGDRPLAINFYRRYISDPGAVADRIQIASERLVTLREAELAASQPAQLTKPDSAGAAAETPPAPPAEPAEPGWTAPEVIGVVMGVTGVIAIGVGAGFGVAAMNETHTVRDLCDGNVCSEQGGIDAAERAEDYATVSTIGFVSGGALIAIGAATYFWLGGEPERPEQSASAGLQLGAQLSQNPGGWSLELAGSW